MEILFLFINFFLKKCTMLKYFWLGAQFNKDSVILMAYYALLAQENFFFFAKKLYIFILMSAAFKDISVLI